MLCVLGLGTNKAFNGVSGEKLLGSAFTELSGFLTGCRISPVYKTAPLYVIDQPPFFNAAVSGEYPRGGKAGAYELLEAVQAVEDKFGRNRPTERRWGERTLDIDILLFGDMSLNEADLVIPHQRLGERAFALRPLLDLLPGAVSPGSAKPYSEALEKLGAQEIESVFIFPKM
jgi:2-amino-4-hydroxy-6-hydroxymethyldihydropteridine diphosphokinase